jgi:hypothetical protein
MVRRETSQNGPLELLLGRCGVLHVANSPLFDRAVGAADRADALTSTGEVTAPSSSRPSQWPSRKLSWWGRSQSMSPG